MAKFLYLLSCVVSVCVTPKGGVSIKVSSYDRFLKVGALFQEIQSATWGTIYIVNSEFVVAIPHCDLVCVCGLPIEDFYLTLDIIPYIGNNPSAALACAWIGCVPSDIDVTR